MLATSSLQSGEHNDLYNIAAMFEELLGVLEAAKIESKGVFINADAGFDSETFKAACAKNEMELNVKPNPRNKKVADGYQYFDEQLYKRRTKIEHANAWMDAFKALLIRFETKAFTWMALQWLAFITLFCRKLKV